MPRQLARVTVFCVNSLEINQWEADVTDWQPCQHLVPKNWIPQIFWNHSNVFCNEDFYHVSSDLLSDRKLPFFLILKFCFVLDGKPEKDTLVKRSCRKFRIRFFRARVIRTNFILSVNHPLFLAALYSPVFSASEWLTKFEWWGLAQSGRECF